MKKVLSFLAVITMLAAPAYAENGHVQRTTLTKLGLGSAEILSDEEGMQIRGQAVGSAMAMGLSLVTGLLIDPATKSFVFGVDASGAVATSEGMTPVSAVTGQGSSINLSLNVTTNTSMFIGTLIGGAGGGAFASAP